MNVSGQATSRQTGVKLSLQRIASIFAEIWLIFSLLCGVFLAIALFTFMPSDPGWSNAASHGTVIANSAGTIGAWCADVILNLFGYPGYLAPLVLICVCWYLSRFSFTALYYADFGLRVTGMLLLLLGSCALAEVYYAHRDILPVGSGGGGVLGSFLADVFLEPVGITGFSLLMLMAMASGLAFAFNISWVNVSTGFGILLCACGDWLWRQTRLGYAWSASRILAWYREFMSAARDRQGTEALHGAVRMEAAATGADNMPGNAAGNDPGISPVRERSLDGKDIVAGSEPVIAGSHPLDYMRTPAIGNSGSDATGAATVSLKDDDEPSVFKDSADDRASAGDMTEAMIAGVNPAAVTAEAGIMTVAAPAPGAGGSGTGVVAMDSVSNAGSTGFFAMAGSPGEEPGPANDSAQKPAENKWHRPGIPLPGCDSESEDSDNEAEPQQTLPDVSSTPEVEEAEDMTLPPGLADEYVLLEDGAADGEQDSIATESTANPGDAGIADIASNTDGNMTSISPAAMEAEAADVAMAEAVPVAADREQNAMTMESAGDIGIASNGDSDMTSISPAAMEAEPGQPAITAAVPVTAGGEQSSIAAQGAGDAGIASNADSDMTSISPAAAKAEAADVAMAETLPVAADSEHNAMTMGSAGDIAIASNGDSDMTSTSPAATEAEPGQPAITTAVPVIVAAGNSAVTAKAPVLPDIPLPPLTLLSEAEMDNAGFDENTLQNMAQLVEQRLGDFGVACKVVGVMPGPVITCFELELAPGIKGSKITNLSRDLARALSVVSVRVVEIIPGKSVLGLEVPNEKRETVNLREILSDHAFADSDYALPIALGKDIGGIPAVVGLDKMPHVLVAGTTGSGKSVALNAMILSILYKVTARQVRMIMIDPKMLELSVYQDIPHLLAPVVTDMKEASNALQWCVAEMERRYRVLAATGVRNIAGYHRKQRASTEDSPDMPYIVVVIDELADMMMVTGKKVEEQIARLAQKARAAGIHLILATQRPSVDVITGLIKANIPSRISFQVSSRIDSRTILDQMGAETLLGHGDMLYLPVGAPVPSRLHGAFVDDGEVHRVADWLRMSSGGITDYIDDVVMETDEAAAGDGKATDSEGQDPLYEEARAVVLESGRPSISYVQRRMRIGYNRAARLLEEMEDRGVVSAPESNGSREVLQQQPTAI